MSIALGGVFNSGILATGVRQHTGARFDYAPAAQSWVDRVAAIEQVCEQFGVPLRAAALQFPLAHPAIEILMVGAQEAAHWQDAVAMLRHRIDTRFWAALRARGWIAPGAPTPGEPR